MMDSSKKLPTSKYFWNKYHNHNCNVVSLNFHTLAIPSHPMAIRQLPHIHWRQVSQGVEGDWQSWDDRMVQCPSSRTSPVLYIEALSIVTYTILKCAVTLQSFWSEIIRIWLHHLPFGQRNKKLITWTASPNSQSEMPNSESFWGREHLCIIFVLICSGLVW